MDNSRPSVIKGYEDWPAYVKEEGLEPLESPLGAVLRPPRVPDNLPITMGESVTRDGVRTTQLSWQLGFGPRTNAYLATPENYEGTLPGLLLLHCHSGNKWLGSERMVDLGDQATPEALELQRTMYGGQAVASTLAAQGFAVLTHDTFAWGSRRFGLDPAPERSARHLHGQQALWRETGVTETEELTYNAAAADHENTIAKVSAMIGTTFPGVVAHDDLAALNILRNLPMVDADRIGTVGASGGGGRSMVLATLSPHVRSHVVSMMMTTYDSLLPAYVDAHSWLMFPPGLSDLTDWPLIPLHAVAPPPRSMHVQFTRQDELFPLDGMQAADELLRTHHSDSFRYSSAWFDGTHAMTPELQDDAARFFRETLT